MLDWLDAIPNLGVSGVPGVPSRFSGGLSGTPAIVGGVLEHLGGTPGTPVGTPRHIIKTLINIQEHLEHRTNDRSMVVAGWARELARIDPCQPPEGFGMGRWQSLYDDALWLLDGFGGQAAREGWSIADFFGLWPGKPRWGGIADRLGGARSLVMDADRASWRNLGQVERYARGAYPHLLPFWREQP